MTKNTIIKKFSDLDRNWDVERILKKNDGKKSYIKKDGEWIEKEYPNRTDYIRGVVYLTDEEYEKLVYLQKQVKMAEKEYKDFLKNL